MERKKINQLVGYGILIFLSGFFGGRFLHQFLQWLILLGSLMTFLGIYFFFKTVNLKTEFEFNQRDDFLTYFWNKLVLKLWTLIFTLWMIVMLIELLTTGHI